MNNTKFKNSILKVLKKDDRLWNEDKTELNQTLLLDLVEKIDEVVIDLLLQEKELREKFFVKIKDVYVFKTNDFRFFMEENKVDNSYTAYKNRIGLTDGKRFLKDTNDVVLDFPYKDCVLEGGQSTEEGTDTYFEYDETVTKAQEKQGLKADTYNQKTAKRKEIFFNSVLAHDEIDRLFDHKALTNWKRFTKDGEQEVKEIKRDKDGTIKENLIIKGNNLLALHSLKKQFAGKVKLIYIDPPFYFANSKQGDSFIYNSNFKLSTWLTFMCNRLEVAKKLLSDDGMIFVQIDDEGYPYLRLLLDHLLNIENFINTIHVKTLDPSGFRSTSDGLFKSTNQILLYGKNKEKSLKSLNDTYIEKKYDSMYSSYLLNRDDHYSKWKWKSIKNYLAEDIYKKPLKELENELGKEGLEIKIEEFAIKNCNNVFQTAAISGGALIKRKKTIEKSKKQKDIVFVHPEEDIEDFYILNGRQILFYYKRIVNIDGMNIPGEYITDLWLDIPYNGIAGEGGITLKGGKKPEKLLQRIINMATNKNDVILDFFGGSGTTGAVAHKMNRQYILIEQMDYIHDLPEARLINVINGDQSGISKTVNWQGGGDFIYFELAKWNETAKEKILACESLEELETFFDEMYERYFLNYNLKIKEFKEKVLQEENFRNLSLDEQKKMFVAMLDNNQMYVNKTEMADKKFGISKEDQKLTSQFYNSEK